MPYLQEIIIAAAGLLIGALLGFWTRKRIVESQFDSIKSYSQKIINEAHKKAKTVQKEAMIKAKDTLYKMKVDFENETKETADKKAKALYKFAQTFKKEKDKPAAKNKDLLHHIISMIEDKIDNWSSKGLWPDFPF